MDVFSLRELLIDQYSSFARSFTEIGAEDIRTQVEAAYDSGRFWPEPLLQINPHFKRNRSVADLVADGTLHPACRELFKAGASATTPSIRCVMPVVGRRADRSESLRPISRSSVYTY